MCPEGSFTNAGSPAMPVADDPELSPLAILAVNTLRETYHQRGPHAFDEAALILFMAVGSIIARTRGPEALHGAMEVLRLAVETEGIDGSGPSWSGQLTTGGALRLPTVRGACGAVR
jgi:hypothetical protein